MVTQYDKEANVLREYSHVISFDRASVTFDNGGYKGKIYADTEAGEYFDDPDNPLPDKPEESFDPELAIAITKGEVD